MRKRQLRILIFAFLFFFLFAGTAHANTPPTANANGPYIGVIGQPVEFSGRGSDDAETGGLLQYMWDFDASDEDDTTEDTNHVTIFHTYLTSGRFEVSLIVDDGIDASLPSASSATIAIQAPCQEPEDCFPENDSPSISLPLELSWPSVAESYYYEIVGVEGLEETHATSPTSGELSEEILELLYPQEFYSWYKNECAERRGHVCNDTEIQEIIIEEQTYTWHVKSCEDIDGTVCGDYGDEWSFVYLLGAPTLVSPPPLTVPVTGPITLDWDDNIIGVKSYEVFAHPCPLFELVDDAGDVEDEGCSWASIEPDDDGNLLSEFEDDLCFFTAETEYAWTVGSCLDESAEFCTDRELTMNQMNQFITPLPYSMPTLDAQNLPIGPIIDKEHPPTDPAEFIPTVSKKDILEWNDADCAFLYQVKVYDSTGDLINGGDCQFGEGDCTTRVGTTTFSMADIENLWDDLDRIYSWSVTPCWRSAYTGPLNPTARCVNTEESEPLWYFKTTGAAPNLEKPENGETVKIPFILSWEDMGGASYVYELSSSSLGTKTATIIGTTTEVLYEIGLVEPGIEDYSWKVKTCVNPDGTECGVWSNEQAFATYQLNPPSNPENPAHNEELFLPNTLSWQEDPGANYYQYKLANISIDPKETFKGCAEKRGTQIIPPMGVGDAPITSNPSFYFNEICRGEYEWAVRSCIDKDCATATNWSDEWIFSASETQCPKEPGLVPCERRCSNADTPYDERESCEVKHLGFMLQNILDFVLWRLSMLVLIVLAVITAASSYFSFGNPNTIANIRTVFRSFLVGFLLLLTAWVIVNVIMGVFGFQIEFFGKWWELPFSSQI